MATDLENLQTYRTNLLTELASVTPARSYSIDGQSVDHNASRRSLLEELRMIEDRIGALQGPFDVNSQGVT